MNILQFIKQIGAVLSWPFKHWQMLEAYFRAAKKDIPPTEAALVGLVKLFGNLSPDVLAALATKGFDIPEDLKAAADIQAIFAYVKDTLFPQIHQDYTDLKLAAAGDVPVTQEAQAAVVLRTEIQPEVNAAKAAASADPAPPDTTGVSVISMHPASEQVQGVPA